MGFETVGAVLDTRIGVAEAAAALIAQAVQRAIAEQAVKAFLLHALMAGKILTFPILKKLVMLHILLLTPLSMGRFPEVGGKTPFSLRFWDG